MAAQQSGTRQGQGDTGLTPEVAWLDILQGPFAPSRAGRRSAGIPDTTHAPAPGVAPDVGQAFQPDASVRQAGKPDLRGGPSAGPDPAQLAALAGGLPVVTPAHPAAPARIVSGSVLAPAAAPLALGPTGGAGAPSPGLGNDGPGKHHPPVGGGDPLYVYDANKGVTLPGGVPLNDFSTWAVDLRAQVSGATVSSYSWNLSQAADATSVSGQSSYRLQFTWASFTGAAHSDTITLTTTNTDLSHNTLTLTFQVTATDSPAYSSSSPTTASTWASVLTPDALLGQPTAPAGPYAALGLAAGDAQTAHTLPAYNPGVSPLGLVYGSAAANAQPIFLVHYPLDPTQSAAPGTVTAQLTFNGTAGSTVYYNTSSLNPGDLMQMALQANATSLSTGRYPWQITVTANYGTPQQTTYSGSVDVVNDASSPFGAGWTLANVERLWPVTGGVILEEPGGQSLWFANGQQAGTFVTPAGDFSTLSQNTGTGVYTRTLTNGTQITFNSTGLQTAVVDRIGNTTNFGYNGSNQLTTVTDLNNLVTTLAYSGGLVNTITDPANRTTTLGYNGSNQLTSVTDPDSGVWRFGYDSSNRLTTLTDPRSATTSADTTTIGYNAAGRATSVTLPDSNTESLTAVQLQGLAAPGTGTQVNPATAVLAAASTANFTDPRSNAWATELDWLGFGAPTSQADPLADTALTYRDSNGLPWLSADALGRRTRRVFDSKGNPTSVTRPDDTQDTAAFNGFAEPTQATTTAPAFASDGGTSFTTSYSYDSHGNLTQSTDPLSNTYQYSYTSKGSVSTMTDPNLAVTTYAYDSRNHLTTVTDPLSHTTTYGYDSASDRTSVTNGLGFTSTFSFDPVGRRLGQTIPVTATTSAVTTLTYDAAGNLAGLKDPDSNLTTYAYDGMNRQTASTDPLGHHSTSGYDAAGNLTSMTDRDGRQTTYSYDAADRKTGETWVSASPSYTATYAYNAAGQLTSESDPYSSYQFTYDSDGRLSTVSDSGTPGLASVTLTYGYNSFDDRTSVSDSRNGTITYR
jgi:YD repeat-containing protein